MSWVAALHAIGGRSAVAVADVVIGPVGIAVDCAGNCAGCDAVGEDGTLVGETAMVATGAVVFPLGVSHDASSNPSPMITLSQRD